MTGKHHTHPQRADLETAGRKARRWGVGTDKTGPGARPECPCGANQPGRPVGAHRRLRPSAPAQSPS